MKSDKGGNVCKIVRLSSCTLEMFEGGIDWQVDDVISVSSSMSKKLSTLKKVVVKLLLNEPWVDVTTLNYCMVFNPPF